MTCNNLICICPSIHPSIHTYIHSYIHANQHTHVKIYVSMPYHIYQAILYHIHNIHTVSYYSLDAFVFSHIDTHRAWNSWNCCSLVAWSGQVRSFGPGCGWGGWISAWVCRSTQETTTPWNLSNRELDLRWDKMYDECYSLSNLVSTQGCNTFIEGFSIYWSIRCTLTMLRKSGKENRWMKYHSSNFWVKHLSQTPDARPKTTYCTHSRCRSSGCNEDLSIWSAGLFTHSRIKQNKLALASLLAIIAGLTNTSNICISTTQLS